MIISYDLHIHSALSPCGNSDMTPNNIVNMALLCELDIIAVTDHNTCENVAAVMEVANKTDILVIPGMEIETREEVHMLCLFQSLSNACDIQEIVYHHLPKIKNKKEIFGEQIRFNSQDDQIGHVDKLLSFACDFSLDELVALCESVDGVCIPAHIDRPSYSIVSNLGMVPEYLGFKTLEISRHSKLDDYRERYQGYQLIQSSDAHDLGYIGSCHQYIDIPEKSVSAVIKKLKLGISDVF